MSILNTAKCAACKYKFEYKACMEKYGYYDKGKMYCSYSCMRYGQNQVITPQYLRNCERVKGKEEEQPVEQEKKTISKEMIDRVGRMKVLLATGLDWQEAAVKAGWKVNAKNPSWTKGDIRKKFEQLGEEVPECLKPQPAFAIKREEVEEEPIMEEIIEKATETATEAVEVKEEEKATDTSEKAAPFKSGCYVGIVPPGTRVQQLAMDEIGCYWNIYKDGRIGLMDCDHELVATFNKDQMWQMRNIAEFLWGLM